jgi:hypothetical protein
MSGVHRGTREQATALAGGRGKGLRRPPRLSGHKIDCADEALQFAGVSRCEADWPFLIHINVRMGHPSTFGATSRIGCGVHSELPVIDISRPTVRLPGAMGAGYFLMASMSFSNDAMWR